MSLTALIFLSVGLAMDAFSVAVCKGLSMKKIDYRGGFITAMFFGVFQAVMPVIGYFLGAFFADYITKFSHWVGFVLLVFIGGKMVWEALCEDKNDDIKEYSIDIKELFLLAIATSIDALAVGIVFAAEKTNIVLSATLIGAITFALSFAGIIIGNRFGSKYETKAEVAGGIVLIIIGAKILLEGLGIIK